MLYFLVMACVCGGGIDIDHECWVGGQGGGGEEAGDSLGERQKLEEEHPSPLPPSPVVSLYLAI